MEFEEIRKRAGEDVEKAATAEEIAAIRIKYFGRKQGEINALLKSLKDMSEAEKRELGPQIQNLKNEIEKAINFKEEELKAEGKETDITLPGKRTESGHLNLITQTENEIRRIFGSMNFSAIEGPEMEEEYYNFDALNIPPDHPAREMWDTFWMKPSSAKAMEGRGKKYLLRTHTSPVQIRYMEKHNPPFQIISLGKTFRYEATDATHETNFYQLEGLMIGRDVSLANFKFVITEFFRQFFSEKTVKVRFRSSYFPFTEPSVEVDVRLDDSKWLEMGGAGMVHPKVLKNVGYNPTDWQGFAFGFGVERLAIIKHKIPDIRLFESGDLRFTKKF
ncbi:MAG: phenylalanine--tRNA ligase subunit alpha [Parcubacteria group bacterium]